MLEVVFHRDSLNRLSSIVAEGHVEYAIEADDVICAAVSAILQAARLGLQAYAGVALEAHQEPGTFRIRWPEDVRDDPAIRAIAATAELSVEQIARQYPEHISISRRPEISS